MARQRLGQHFLGDEGWRIQIAQAIGLAARNSTASGSSDDFCWIEIGAGHGEMTRHLLDTGRPVYALEIDPPLIANLEKLSKKNPNLTVVPGDVLKSDLRAIAAGRRIRIYGNLPYYITSPILHHLFETADLIDRIHILIQLEVAERLVADPGQRSYGYLSVLTQYYSWPGIDLHVPRKAFSPPPEVDSALVTVRLPGVNARLGIADSNDFLEFVKRCFGQKRKTVVNNLRDRFAPEQLRELLRSLTLREDARAEQLSVSDLVRLYNASKSASEGQN